MFHNRRAQIRRPFVAAGGGTTLKTGMRAFWEFENTSWLDATGNFPLTVDGGSAPSIVTGKVGNAVQMNAVSTGFLSEATGTLSLSGTPFSISGWVNVPSFAADYIVMSKQSVAAHRQFSVHVYSTGVMYMVLFDAADSGSNVNGTVPLTAGVWSFFCATYDGVNALTIQVNGQTSPDTATFAVTIPTSTDTLDVGGAFASTTFTGSADQLGVWNKVLTPTEIALLWNGGSGLAYSAM